MALRKSVKLEYPKNFSNYNETGDGNPSHLVDQYTNFVLRPITYENLDEAVFKEFHNRWTISNKQLPILLLDAEVASLPAQNYMQFDQVKGYLNLPYFTMWRSKVSPLYRSSPSNKPVVFAIPKKKEQGIVYEEWITPPPKVERLSYTFKFMTVYREHVNHFEAYMNDYFKNKRNVIVLDWERFEIMPSNSEERGTLEVVDREGVNGQSLYVITYELDLIAYTRRKEDIQKRERKNTVDIRITERSGGKITTLNQTATRLPKPGEG